MLRERQEISGYQQLSDLIRNQIAAGVFPSGSQLPTEMEISRKYRLNRHTVRRAFEIIAHEGLIYRLRGKGTFVASQKIPYRISTKTQFTAAILEAGLTPEARLLNSYELGADRELAELLEIKTQERVLVLEILRYADKLPFCFTRSYLPAAKYPGLIQVLPESFSLYRVIAEHFGIEASRESSTFEVQSLARDQHGEVAEFCSSKFRGDFCSISINFCKQGRKV